MGQTFTDSLNVGARAKDNQAPKALKKVVDVNCVMSPLGDALDKQTGMVPGTGIEPARRFYPSDGFSSHYDFRRQLTLFVRWTMPLPLR